MRARQTRRTKQVFSLDSFGFLRIRFHTGDRQIRDTEMSSEISEPGEVDRALNVDHGHLLGLGCHYCKAGDLAIDGLGVDVGALALLVNADDAPPSGRAELIADGLQILGLVLTFLREGITLHRDVL